MTDHSAPGSDWPLFDAEIRASLAYADALVTPSVLTETERDTISAALRQIATEYEREALSGDDPFEVIDARLEVLVGSLAGKFQAGRSRNERLLTAIRLWLIGQMEILGDQIADVQRALLHQAEGRVGALMPGYSHFQPIQIVSCGHWLQLFLDAGTRSGTFDGQYRAHFDFAAWQRDHGRDAVSPGSERVGAGH